MSKLAPLWSYNHAVKVTSMIDGYLVAAVDVGVDEVLVENVDVGCRGAPCPTTEFDQTRVQQELNLLCSLALKRLPLQEIGRVVLL